ncbi:ribonuclease D [mine drainage metagenome]|uniref:Ribonuclease D n=1 Tax=mine drainage metagenome TaxID=410659 RepID=A0A1J5SHW6_9ZZZZ
MAIHYHLYDLPDTVAFNGSVAIDTETMGLSLQRDRLCVIQLSAGDGEAHLVHFPTPDYAAPRLRALLAENGLVKLFHFARFDLAMIQKHFGVICQTVYCTKVASKLSRTNCDRHGLRDLCRELLGVDLSKQQQTSDWGAPRLSEEQRTYAASDVLHLHTLKERLDHLLDREGRRPLAEACFSFLPIRAALDLAGWSEEDIFSH